MLWQCAHCQSLNPGMSGNERESLKCKNCGAEKADEPWIMPDSPEHAKALEGELDRKARLGPNWACKFCKAESRADRKTCEVCGATRAETPRPPAPAVRRTNSSATAAPAHVPLGPPREPPPYEDEPSVHVDPIVSRPTAPPAKAWEAVTSYRQAPLVEPPPPSDLPDVMTHYEPWDIIKVILGVLFVAMIGWFIYWIFSPNETTVRISRMSWSRERRLEERHDYAGEGWRRQAPPLVYAWDACETRQSGTERCHPHDCNCGDERYECNCTGGSSYSCNCRRSCRTSCSSNRNGSASCSESCSESCSTCTTPRRCSTCSRRRCDTCYDQCPVYEDWCRYRYHQWDRMAQQRTAGEGRECAWPALEAHGPLQRIQADERYTVRFDDTGSPRTWTRDYDYARYEGFEVGQRWRVGWTRAGGFTLRGRAP